MSNEQHGRELYDFWNPKPADDHAVAGVSWEPDYWRKQAAAGASSPEAGEPDLEKKLHEEMRREFDFDDYNPDWRPDPGDIKAQMYFWLWNKTVKLMHQLREATPPTPAPSPNICPWCKTNAKEAAARHEGPHATWCVHFRNEQRGGPKPAPSREALDEQLVIDLARELYDRFVMGGWEPQDAYPQIRAMLRAKAKP